MTQRAHILVVDDEPDIRTLVQEILEDEGYEVSVAEDAPAGRGARTWCCSTSGCPTWTASAC